MHRLKHSRVVFAYSVFDKNNSRCLGSVYIDPSRSSHYDCEVHFWVRADSAFLDAALHTTILRWLEHHWLFAKVVFPGRNIDWEAWDKELNIKKD